MAYITASGKHIPTYTNAYGELANHAYYWDQVRANNPTIKWSANNQWKLDHGFAPIADQFFIDQFPQFAAFKGEAMDHHHLDHGPIAHGLPKTLHTGKSFTKMWHKFGKAKVVVGFTIAFLGSVGDALAATGIHDDPIGVADPLGVTIAGEHFLNQTDEHLIEMAMSRGYKEAIKYFENCLSCSGFGVYYASNEETVKFIQGEKLDLNSGSFYEGFFYDNIQNANANSGSKQVTHAIIYTRSRRDGFVPVGVLEME